MTVYQVAVSDQPLHTKEFFQQIRHRSSNKSMTAAGSFSLMKYLLREHLYLVSVGALVNMDLDIEFSVPFGDPPKLWSQICHQYAAPGPSIECKVASVGPMRMKLKLHIRGLCGFDSDLDFWWLAIGHERVRECSERYRVSANNLRTGDAARARVRHLACRIGVAYVG